MKLPPFILVSFIILMYPSSIYSVVIHVPADSTTIQAAIDGAADGDTVLVADGIYAGEGNRDIRFGGKAILVMSERGPFTAIVECGGSEPDPHRGFVFDGGEGVNSVLRGFTITHGWAESGAAVACSSSSPTIDNNIITENTAVVMGGGILCEIFAAPLITDNTIGENTADLGGGIACFYSTPLIEDNRIESNTSRQRGGGIILQWSSATVSGNLIQNNDSEGSLFGAGGITCEHNSHASIIENSIIGNSSSSNGGGIGIRDDSGPLIRGNLITGNYAHNGGGVLSRQSSPLIVNNTIVANAARYNGGGIMSVYGIVIRNCIIRDNMPQELEGDDFVVSYSDIRGGWPGEGNIRSDPLFKDPAGGDFSLLIDSPCIDSGDPESEVPPLGGERADMGAFEFPYRGDSPVHLEFWNTPLTIEPGESVIWLFGLGNTSFAHVNVDEWISVSGPSSAILDSVVGIFIPPRGVKEGAIHLIVPPSTPPGSYTVKGYAGIMHEEIWDGNAFVVDVPGPF